MDERRIEYLPLDDITPAVRNPKRHDLAAIRASIARFGIASLALRDERTGRLVVGHGRTDALQAMRADGETPPAGVRVDGDVWLVPVVCGWASRSDQDAQAYLAADNNLAALGGWDNTQLAELLGDLAAFDPALLEVTGFSQGDLEALLADTTAGRPAPVGLTDPDDAPDVPTQPITQPGDVWLLGPHRLLCGDATDPRHVDQVLADLGEPGIVYTDPPYGISIVKDNGKIGGGGKFRGKIGLGKVVPSTEYMTVAGDDTTTTAADAFRLLHARHPMARHVWWGGNHYTASAGLPDASCWLVWDKQNDGSNFADAELAWTNHPGAVRMLRHMWNGMLRASERGKRVHPTQKPVALAEWAFSTVDPKNERMVVLDAFAGSGSTLIAAHRTGRAAAVIELEPAYVDVIARRFQEHTGIVPILQSTGEPVDLTGVHTPTSSLTSTRIDQKLGLSTL